MIDDLVETTQSNSIDDIQSRNIGGDTIRV